MFWSVLGVWLACQGRGDGLWSNVESLRVEPASLELRVQEGSPAELEFVAWATLPDGEELPLDLVTWSHSNSSIGEIGSDGVFRSVDTHGGVSEIRAQHLDLSAEATLTLVYEEARIDEDLDEDLVSAFEGSQPAEDDSLELLYPLAGATLPRNIEGLEIGWVQGGEDEVYRLIFESELAEITVVTQEHPWRSSAELWSRVAATNQRGEVSLSVEAARWSGGQLSDHRRGPSISLTVNRLDARGSVFYWSTGEEAILRIPFGAEEASIFWQEPAGECTGCHSVGEGQDTMVITHNGVNGTFSVLDLSDIENPVRISEPRDESRLTFSAISPDGSLILGVQAGEAILFDAESGVELRRLETEHPVSHPGWRPDGEAMLFVHIEGTYYSDMDFERGEVVEYPWDGESLGEPQVLASCEGDENCFYPTWSPDGAWLAYNRGEGRSYANLTSRLWLRSEDGSIETELKQAQGDESYQNSFPRWAPLPDDEVLWLAYSSTRPHPLHETHEPHVQIWVTAVDTEQALTGEDPSSTPFWLPGQDPNFDNHLAVWWRE